MPEQVHITLHTDNNGKTLLVITSLTVGQMFISLEVDEVIINDDRKK